MHFKTSVAALASISALAAAQAPSIDQWTQQEINNGTAWTEVTQIASENQIYNLGTRGDVSCQYGNAKVRKEFRHMSNADRKAFTDAATCLMKTPPQHMRADQAKNYPGVKSRHDEYVATHINMTMNIHATADFLAWHRNFIWHYESDLKTLCGYEGTLPYWNWALDAAAPQDSPLFNGDEYSMGSNGEYISGRSDTYLYTQGINMPPGTGGGCVTSGPFKSVQLHLGPLDLPNAENVNSNYQYNPRCLKRDFNSFFSNSYNTISNVTELVLESIYLEDFQDRMQGYASGDPFGVHGGGHWTVGGDASDFHSSPNDPLFFLHHGMIDYIWTTWQNLDIYRRQLIIKGTSTLGNSPPSAEMTLDDMIPFGFVTGDVEFRKLMDTFGDAYCYRYE
ncbi:Di-copper centre-containing protein [Aureobasidium pullulans]|uniref:Di-copper centre-containing protein n=1 Tax=Aureobasidium pullulans TaxID=5580 RepID=A0A4S9LTZ6_AURPU|nr:Di-copper centre-containing protein [Aureobasidium pullulans]THZ76124.1 Di-copper centre-containing protein [Aureobasidium pullulans]